ncbi:CheR family methyltransferase [Halobacillus sp. MO56]
MKVGEREEAMSEEYSKFITAIKSKTGIDLSLYKEAQMKRRLISLRNKRGYNDFEEYFNVLARDQDVMEEFLDRMTINVSEFFRNPARWEVFEKKVVPQLLQTKRSIKVWSAACSTGEEPYTLAILLSKYLPLNRVEILATDLDENALIRARKGVYPERALKEVPATVLQKHFKLENGLYKIDDSIKQAVHFKKHNLLSDSYDKNFDLIVCRNVLIYFTEDAKRMIYQKIRSSLCVQGFFFVGSTEQIFSPKQYGLHTFDSFFYQRLS